VNGTITIESDIVTELTEIQPQFDDYQAETSVNLVHLQKDAVTAQHEVAQLAAQLVKATAKLEVARGRLCLLIVHARVLLPIIL
jgi:hypothetical protein